MMAPGQDEVLSPYDVEGTPIIIFTAPRGTVLACAVGGIGRVEFMEMVGNLDG
jgi:hypothetical protein